MCGGQAGLQMFELDPHEQSNMSRLPMTDGLVPFKLQMDLGSHLLAVLMRPWVPCSTHCDQLHILEPESGELPLTPVHHVLHVTDHPDWGLLKACKTECLTLQQGIKALL